MKMNTVISYTILKNTTIFFFFFNDTATTEIYTLSLHDALPISSGPTWTPPWRTRRHRCAGVGTSSRWPDRKSTRLNSSHGYISYAVFCLKKKNKWHLSVATAQSTTETL